MMNRQNLKQPAGMAALMALVPLSAPTDLEIPKGDDVSAKPQFEAPVALTAGGQPIRVEAPGFASPAWHDVDGDGNADLVVGQFKGGKLAVYRGLEDGKLAERTWLQADGKVAEVPGVW